MVVKERLNSKNLVILVLLGILAAVLVTRSGGECGELCEVDAIGYAQTIENIDADGAYALIQQNAINPYFVILDIRTPDEYASGYIEGSTNLDYYAQSFSDDLADLEKENTYLIYCRTGRRTAEALEMMKELGFMEVYNMMGGITGWEAGGYPVIK